MNPAIEAAMLSYFGQSNRGEAIYIDTNGTYKGIPAPFLRQHILSLISHVTSNAKSRSAEDIAKILPPHISVELSDRLEEFLQTMSFYEVVPKLNKDFNINVPYRIANGDILSPNQVVSSFEEASYGVSCDSREMRKIVTETAQFLIDRLRTLSPYSTDYHLLVQQMASSLGNCRTPVKQLLFSMATQLPLEVQQEFDPYKMQEIIQRVAFRQALLRAIRLHGYSFADLSKEVEVISNAVFHKGGYDFSDESQSPRHIETPHKILLDTGIVNIEENLNSENLYNFIKSDLFSIQKPLSLTDKTLNRVQEVIFNAIKGYSEAFVNEYLENESERFYLLLPNRIESDFKQKLKNHFHTGFFRPKFTESNLNRFTQKYLQEKFAEIRAFAQKKAKETPQKETTLETAMTTNSASLNPNVSTSGGGSAQTLPELSEIQNQETTTSTTHATNRRIQS